MQNIKIQVLNVPPTYLYITFFFSQFAQIRFLNIASIYMLVRYVLFDF